MIKLNKKTNETNAQLKNKTDLKRYKHFVPAMLTTLPRTKSDPQRQGINTTQKSTTTTTTKKRNTTHWKNLVLK